MLKSESWQPLQDLWLKTGVNPRTLSFNYTFAYIEPASTPQQFLTHPEDFGALEAHSHWQVIPAVRVSLESARKRGEPKHWARASAPSSDRLLQKNVAQIQGFEVLSG